MKIRLLVVFFLIFVYGCDGGGTSGGSGSVQPLTVGNAVGDWNVVETYKTGKTYQWKARFLVGGRIDGGAAYWEISAGQLVIRNPYSYWVAPDLSNSKHFVAYGPVSNLDFSKI